MQEVAPLYLASIRFFTAGIFIVLICRLFKFQLRISRRQLINTIIAGFLFLTFGNGIFVWALKYVDSGFAALLASTQPMFVLILMKVLYDVKVLPKAIVGVILGIIGMTLLVHQQEMSLSENSIIGILMIFTCVLSWSYGSVFVSKHEMPVNHLVSTGYQMLWAGIMLYLGSIIAGEPRTAPIHWSQTSQLSMLLLIVFGSVIAFTSFNYLLKVVSPEKVATSAYVNPVIAIFLGWYVLDEKISTESVIAALIILTGVYFINRKKRIFKKLS